MMFILKEEFWNNDNNTNLTYDCSFICNGAILDNAFAKLSRNC